jgi:hypothetical protein
MDIWIRAPLGMSVATAITGCALNVVMRGEQKED